MKFLIDEDVPAKLLKTLVAAGHDAVRVTASAPDRDIARQAVSQQRVLITLDKDFTDRLLYPPATHNIIHIQIHPPFADNIIAVVQQILKEVPENKLKGLIILQKDGHVRIFE